MTLTMADSIVARSLPPGMDAYAGYVDTLTPSWRDYAQIVEQSPGAKHMSITTRVAFDPVADCLDVETRDATVAQAAPFIQSQPDAWRVLYTFQANGATLLSSVRGIPRSRFKLLTAHWGQGIHICGPTTCGVPWQADGTQWLSTAAYDLSVLADDFFQTPQTTKGDDDMYASPDGNKTVFRLSGYTPDAGQEPNSPVEKWRELPAEEAASVVASGVPVYGAGMLSLWAKA
jgi:hypothetical protein